MIFCKRTDFINKRKGESIKSLLIEEESYLGVFREFHKDLLLEKEVSLIKIDAIRYLLPTPMLICCLDNIQVRFHIRFYILMMSHEADNPNLIGSYNIILTVCKQLGAIHKNKFFKLMKNSDAYVVGWTVNDEINDMDFSALEKEVRP